MVRVFTRMLDNVVEINGLPLEQQRDEIMRKRRHGMGFLGLGSTMTLLGMKYGSPESVQFTEDVSREMAVAGWEAAPRAGAREGSGADHERGVHGHQGDAAQATGDGARRLEAGREDRRAACCTRATAATCSASPRSRRSWSSSSPRSARVSRITPRSRPTGTISLSLANNASNGIEPSFAHHYFRNVIRDGKKSKEKVDVFSFELLAYRELVNRRPMPERPTMPRELPDYFIAADDVTPQRARRHPGRGPEVGRFLDLQDRERADGFPLREVQGHLPVCARDRA